MTDEEKQIAIAELCGWRIENYGPVGYEKLYWLLREPSGKVRCGGCTGEAWSRVQFSTMVPAYLNDLNAMRAAEKIIVNGDPLVKSRWFIWLQKNGDCCGIHATAAQRAEAFLRTLNIW